MYDSSPRQIGFPALTPAVKVLMLVNVGVFFANMLVTGQLGEWLSLSRGGLLDGFGLGLLRFVSYQFTHSFGDIGHILMNMLVLYFFGTMVEREVGQRGMYRLYLISGFVGGAAQLLLGLFFGVDPWILGASGACYGIMVYAACMAPTANVLFFGIFPIQLRLLVGILVFIGLYETYLGVVRGASGGGSAHGAHLGGALWGFVAFKKLRHWHMLADQRPGLLEGAREGLRARREARRAHEAARDRATLDALLDKVHREGMSALTENERRFLERASKDMKGR